MTSQEKSFFVFTFCAISLLVAFAFTTDGRNFFAPMIGMLGIGDATPENAHRYCLDKRYSQSSFCEGRRIEEREKWRTVVNSSRGGKSAVFSLGSGSR